MAISENYIDKITKDGDSRIISPSADNVRVDNENFDGADLDEVLDEVAQAIDEAGGGGYEPPVGGIPKTDLASDVQASLGKADTALQSYTETDPTVPSWAKQPSKPGYNVAEITYSSGRMLSSKLDEMDAGIAAASDVDSEMSDSSTKAVQNKVIKDYVDDGLADKVDKVTGKGLSTNDYTDAEKSKLAGIAAGATANQGTVTGIKVNDGQVQEPTNGVVSLQIEEGGGASQEISILFVGNSLTQDAVSYLPLVLKEIAPNLTFNIYMWYDGGSTLTEIVGKWNNNTAAQIFSTCENVTSWTNANNTQKMGAFLSSGKTFDIVCLEEYFNYKRENGYTAADKQSFADAIAYIRTNYAKPFKVVSFFHRPLCKDTNNQVDLSIADEVFGLTYDGVRWQLENTISEGVVPAGIAAYRGMYDSVLNGLGDFGYMSPDGTHAQEGLPCLMQAWVTALWVLDQMSIPVSINNAQGRVTTANYSSINVPGPNLGTGVVVGTDAQDKEAMNVAINGYKEGKKMEEMFITPFGVPAYKIVIDGASGTKDERNVKLSASLLPADAQQADIVWSIVSGTATVDSNGVVTYSGSALTASVVVHAKVNGYNLQAEATLSFALAAVDTPVFTPAAGTYTSGQSVAITCSTDGATIYYTTDGSTPTSSSSVYSSPISVSTDTTIKAVAMKDGEISAVATSAYSFVSPTFTVSVGNYAGAVNDANVVMIDGNDVEHQPVEISGGSYYFAVEDGTYTLAVSKVGYVEVSTSVTVGGGSPSTSVALKRNLLAKAFVTNANCMGTTHSPLYPTMNAATSSSAPTVGAYIQAFTGGTRCGIAIHRGDAANPVEWQHWSNSSIDSNANTIAAKAFCSLIEWPLDCQAIRIRMTNTEYYACSGVCDIQQTEINLLTSDWIQGGSGFDYTLNRSTYTDDYYLGFWMKYKANSAWNNNTTIESLGLTIEEV